MEKEMSDESTPVDTSAYNMRDFKIFKKAIEDLSKKISKSARLERQHIGNGQFSELEDYLEHLQRKIDCTLDPNEVVVTTGDR